MKNNFQFVQTAQEFLLPKMKQKYVLWFCCDGGIFNKNSTDEDDDSLKALTEMYDDLNIQQLDRDDPKIKQVRDFIIKFLSATERD